MTYEAILIPTDGGERMDEVVDHALDIAVRRDATVHALYVIDDRSHLLLRDDVVEEVTTELGEEGTRATEDVAAEAVEAGVDAVVEIRKGDPGEVILDYVHEHGIDLIAMGTHGRTKYEGNILGSVSQKVVPRSDVPVLTVNISDA